ncbi:Fasciclin-2 [Portunus trituberculatus]|uniref:Fasciclin-2 n=1 Tax=Portunus trituberculatus TaxID=210409 RepID=A0A5B7CTN3_PORTR|nr:Fasciclin-2 [Portunus trituberculatus]
MTQFCPVTYFRIHVEEAEAHNGVDLIFDNILRRDRGNYTCSANVDGEEVSKSFQLFVDNKPLWNDDKTKAYSYVDGSVNLTCEVKAEPEANFTWTKDDSVIYPSEITQIFNDNNTSILQLKVTEQRMFGDYLCIAQNKLGTLERVIILQQGQKPAIPTAKRSWLRTMVVWCNISKMLVWLLHSLHLDRQTLKDHSEDLQDAKEPRLAAQKIKEKKQTWEVE